MKVRLLEDAMVDGGLNAQGEQLPPILRMTIRKGRHIAWTKGTVIDMSETSAQNLIDKGKAELAPDDLPPTEPAEDAKAIYGGDLPKGNTFEVVEIHATKGRLIVKDEDGKMIGGHDVDVTGSPFNERDVSHWTKCAKHIGRTA